jgi:hypothetical protein
MELHGDDEVANLFQFLVIRFSNVEVQIELLFGVDGGEFEKSGRRLEFARRKESVVKSQTLCTPLTLFALPWSIFGVASCGKVSLVTLRSNSPLEVKMAQICLIVNNLGNFGPHFSNFGPNPQFWPVWYTPLYVLHLHFRFRPCLGLCT